MKKLLVLTFAYTLTISSTTLCMLHRQLSHIQKRARSCYTKHYFPQLPSKNIFNTSKKDLTRKETSVFLEDLWTRNGEFMHLSDNQSDLLEKQNDIALAWISGHSENLDIEALEDLEKELRSTFSENFLKKGNGHANE